MAAITDLEVPLNVEDLDSWPAQNDLNGVVYAPCMKSLRHAKVAGIGFRLGFDEMDCYIIRPLSFVYLEYLDLDFPVPENWWDEFHRTTNFQIPKPGIPVWLGIFQSLVQKLETSNPILHLIQS